MMGMCMYVCVYSHVYVCTLVELGELRELDLSELTIVFQIILCYFQSQFSRN